MMKSSSSVTVMLVTSGSQTMARGFPLNSGSLAYMSPKVRVTDSRPGKARCGPRMKVCSSPS
jgi:hypothetical protein